MIEIDVNGSRRLISEQAYEMLNDKMAMYDMDMCDQSSVLAPNWGCTREAEHIGPHVAHGESGNGAETYAVFTDSVRTVDLHQGDCE